MPGGVAQGHLLGGGDLLDREPPWLQDSRVAMSSLTPGQALPAIREQQDNGSRTDVHAAALGSNEREPRPAALWATV